MQTETRTQSELDPILRGITDAQPNSLPDELRGFSLFRMLSFVTICAVLLAIFLPEARGLFQNPSRPVKIEPDWNADNNALVRQMLRDRELLKEFAEKLQWGSPSEALSRIVSNPKLTNLDLGYSSVTDFDLRAFAHLPNIEEIKLDGTTVTDEGLVAISTLPRLKALSLFECDITDKGIAYLSENTSLKEIDLRDTHVTDAGMDHLATVKRLHKVCLASDGITEEGIRTLLQNRSIRVLVWNAATYEGKKLKDLKREFAQ